MSEIVNWWLKSWEAGKSHINWGKQIWNLGGTPPKNGLRAKIWRNSKILFLVNLARNDTALGLGKNQKSIQPDYLNLSDPEKTGCGHQIYVWILNSNNWSCPNLNPGRVRVWTFGFGLPGFLNYYGFGQIRTIGQSGSDIGQLRLGGKKKNDLRIKREILQMKSKIISKRKIKYLIVFNF